MEKTYIPSGYSPCLNLYDTQKAISLLQRLFEDNLGGALHLRRVSAPLFVEACTGLNDDLNGVERAVSFDIPTAGRDAQVVHSLAKWKRMALYRYQFSVGEGLFTDMNAIRRDELLDNLHSVYVDQWDWEKIIAPRDRNLEYLKDTVRTIVQVVCQTQTTLRSVYPQLTALPTLSPDVTFVTTQELEDLWPDATPHEREDHWVKDHPTTFLMEIGGALKSGRPHDGRAPDYDDWSLNGDILFWNPVLERAFELSSMGIRVDAETMDRQLAIAGCDNRRSLQFHRMLLNNELPQTIGGGIGQSRLCMLLLGKAHIGEVQASVWDEETLHACQEAGVILL
ncbi:MAG: aspartate--ammonia ligase [Oscillospiraceae bacterium]|nr:aspartate--ammonia ligase [Oscillospiraceae bacterium]